MNSKKEKNPSGILKDHDLFRETLLPACAIFCAAVFVFFLVAMAAGINVTESETSIVTKYDDQTGYNDIDSTAPSPDALPVQTLVGIFLFSICIMLASFIFKLEYNRIALRMAHLIAVLLSFFIFILALPGYLSEAGAPAAMLSSIGVTVLYFIILGISKLLKLIKPLHSEKAKKAFLFLLPVFGIFTALVFSISFFNLIFQVRVIIMEKVEEIWLADDVVKTTYARVATPLAPTLQNYFRYLISGLVFMIGYAVLKMKINPVARVLLNFIILSSGFVGIWIAGSAYFSMFEANIITATVVYLSVYLAAVIAFGIIFAVRKRKSEETEDYQSQFSPKRRLSASSDGENSSKSGEYASLFSEDTESGEKN